MAHKVLLAAQMLFSVLIVGVVLLQQKGSGIGMAFGGSSNIYSTKRGIDKMLHTATIALSILFFGSVLASVIF